MTTTNIYTLHLNYAYLCCRSIDCLPATINVLQSIVHASEGKLEVYMDGGISTGLDVFKAVAYGKKYLIS